MDTIHVTVLGYFAAVLGGLIVWRRSQKGEKFTKWQVLQVFLLFAFAFMAVTGLSETILPKLVDGVRAWVGK